MIQILSIVLPALALGLELVGIWLTRRSLGRAPTTILTSGRRYEANPEEVVAELEAHYTARLGIRSLIAGVVVLSVHAVLDNIGAWPVQRLDALPALAVAAGSFIVAAGGPLLWYRLRREAVLKAEVLERSRTDPRAGHSKLPYRDHLLRLGRVKWPIREGETPDEYARRVFEHQHGLTERV